MIAHIINHRYLDQQGLNITIGGVQTYITNLAEVLFKCGYEVLVYQLSDVAFITKYRNISVIGIPSNGGNQYKKGNILLEKAMQKLSGKDDLIIFGLDNYIKETKGVRSIALQHGIGWDVPATRRYNSIRYFINFCHKAFVSWRIIRRVNQAQELVCVDYNFLNWYKAVSPYPKVKINVIPNFSALPEYYPSKHNTNNIKIIFARRFQTFRGTRIFCEAISKVLLLHPELRVTIAGDGPDEKWMKNKLSNYSQVEFITYESEDSLKIHSDKQIAVIPTLGSEGTSLSLLEAMSSQCAVVCSNVGGMTNIVIDRYNGILIDPTVEALGSAIIELVENENLRKSLADNAYETVKSSFSREMWEKRWEKVILRNH